MYSFRNPDAFRKRGVLRSVHDLTCDIYSLHWLRSKLAFCFVISLNGLYEIFNYPEEIIDSTVLKVGDSNLVPPPLSYFIPIPGVLATWSLFTHQHLLLLRPPGSSDKMQWMKSRLLSLEFCTFFSSGYLFHPPRHDETLCIGGSHTQLACSCV